MSYGTDHPAVAEAKRLRMRSGEDESEARISDFRYTRQGVIAEEFEDDGVRGWHVSLESDTVKVRVKVFGKIPIQEAISRAKDRLWVHARDTWPPSPELRGTVSAYDDEKKRREAAELRIRQLRADLVSKVTDAGDDTQQEDAP